MNPHSTIRINEDRFRRDFDELAQIGATTGGGVNRPAFSRQHREARRWFQEKTLQSGLEFHMDGAANHSAILHCAPDGSPTLLLGSHLDSVPDGGRFDGALGVTAALEVLRTVKEHELRLAYNLEAVDFTDEEGAVSGLFGSSAAAGQLELKDLLHPRGGRDALLSGLSAFGVSEETVLEAQRASNRLVGYLELHIEQGPRLEKAGAQIGIVQSIVGIGSYRISFTGRADHAGTTPLPDRLDAGYRASFFNYVVHNLVEKSFPGCVINVGWMRFEPGAFNVVPGQVELGLEYRAADLEIFDRLEDHLLVAAQKIAQGSDGEPPIEVEVVPLGRHNPVQMSPHLQGVLADSARELGLSSMPLSSGAGHDAQMMAHLCPAGMVFVPSVEGRSHSSHEFTRWEDCVNGANVLLLSALGWQQRDG